MPTLWRWRTHHAGTRARRLSAADLGNGRSTVPEYWCRPPQSSEESAQVPQLALVVGWRALIQSDCLEAFPCVLYGLPLRTLRSKAFNRKGREDLAKFAKKTKSKRADRSAL